MDKKLDTSLSYADREALILKTVSKKMGDALPETLLGSYSDLIKLEIEYQELLDWWTDANDSRIRELAEENIYPAQVLSNISRADIKAAEPKKFKRLRELESEAAKISIRNSTVNAAGAASLVEANLRNKVREEMFASI